MTEPLIAIAVSFWLAREALTICRRFYLRNPNDWRRAAGRLNQIDRIVNG